LRTTSLGNARFFLEVRPFINAANYVYNMQGGQIKAQGTAEEKKGSSDIREAYLGI
jgi:ABC-type branched-subunit amino acid transport system ATPase component